MIFALLAGILSIPLSAQVTGKAHEIGIAGGIFIGDNLTDDKILDLNNGFEPIVRYGFNFNERFGIDSSLFYCSTDVSIDIPEDMTEDPLWYDEEDYRAFNMLTDNETDADLGGIDISAVFYVNPKKAEVLYVGAGAGYLVTDIAKTSAAKNSVTGNFVTGLKFFFAKSAVLRLEGKYRYIDKALERGDSMNTFEFSAGVSWVFD